MTVTEPFCRHHPNGHSDDARRMADITQLAWTAYGWDGFVGHWMAFRLSDGGSDNVMYPSKLAAISHSLGSHQYMFAVMHPNGMTVCEAQIMLRLHRLARGRGIATPSIDLPHGGPDLIPRIGYENVLNQIRSLRKAGG